jgi:hypothetical protein
MEAPAFFGSGELGPQELAFEPRDLVQRILQLQVMPTESREDHWQEIHGLLATPLNVFWVILVGVGTCTGRGRIAPDSPGTDDIGEFQQVMERRVGGGIPVLLPPACGHTEHDRTAIRFEKPDERAAFLEEGSGGLVENTR